MDDVEHGLSMMDDEPQRSDGSQECIYRAKIFNLSHIALLSIPQWYTNPHESGPYVFAMLIGRRSFAILPGLLFERDAE